MIEGVRQSNSMHAFVFSFLWAYKKKKKSQILFLGEQINNLTPQCEIHAKTHEDYKATKRKQKAPEKQRRQTQRNCHIHVDKWAVCSLQHAVKVHAMQSE